MNESHKKPLGRKSYGHIPHLHGSRVGPRDHKVHEGQHRIATVSVRDRHDRIIVQEKLDGSCVSVAKIAGEIVALGRVGYRAFTSNYPQHVMFSKWVMENEHRFSDLLDDCERVVGEWLIQAHGTRYELPHEPFVIFDIMRENKRAPVDELLKRVEGGDWTTPRILSKGDRSFSIDEAIVALDKEVRFHGAIGTIEGAVWRVERKGVVDFLCKYVRPGKVDGCYLPDISGAGPVWNSTTCEFCMGLIEKEKSRQ